MNVAPGAAFEAVTDWGATGATIGMRVVDNAGATTVARVTGFTEYPAGSGIYYRDGNLAPTIAGSYTLVYDDDGGTAAVGHVATEDLTVTSNAPGGPFTGDTYATTDELARILKIRTPTTDQNDALERVLLAAAGEINSEIDLDDDTDLAGWQFALAAEVNLERAAELWKQQEVQFNLVGVGTEFGPTHIARNTWEPYAFKLAPLKDQWGLA